MRLAHKILLLVALVFILAVLAAGCGGEGGGSISENYSLSGPQGSVRLAVGSKNFTEQEILGEITSQALEAANAEVIDRTGRGGTEGVRRALISGEIDMYWEYTGTGWLIHLAEPNPMSDPQEQYQAVAEQDLEQNNIEWYSACASWKTTRAFSPLTTLRSPCGRRRWSSTRSWRRFSRPSPRGSTPKRCGR